MNDDKDIGDNVKSNVAIRITTSILLIVWKVMYNNDNDTNDIVKTKK